MSENSPRPERLLALRVEAENFLAISPPPSDYPPLIKTPYNARGEAVYWKGRSKNSEILKRNDRSDSARPPQITADLPQGARARARSSPPAAFNSEIYPLGYRQVCKSVSDVVSTFVSDVVSTPSHAPYQDGIGFSILENWPMLER